MHLGGLYLFASLVATIAALGALVSLGALTVALSVEHGRPARSLSATIAILVVLGISITVIVLSVPGPT